MRRFSRETDLRDPVARWLTESVGATAIADEVDSDHGIADLVGAFDGHLVDRIESNVPALSNLLQVQLIRRLREPVAAEELRAWAPYGWRGLEKRGIVPLVKAGAVEFDGDSNHWRLCRNVPAPFERTVAVELKLKNVRRAVIQAARYRLFAEQSFVAVPANRTTNLAVELVERSGLGLLGVSPNGEVEEVVQPPRRAPINGDSKRLVAERVFGAMFESGPRPVAGSPRGGAAVPALIVV